MVFYGSYAWPFLSMVNTFGKPLGGADLKSQRQNSKGFYEHTYFNPQDSAPIGNIESKFYILTKDELWPLFANHFVNCTYGTLLELHRSLSSSLNDQNLPLIWFRP